MDEKELKGKIIIGELYNNPSTTGEYTERYDEIIKKLGGDK